MYILSVIIEQVLWGWMIRVTTDTTIHVSTSRNTGNRIHTPTHPHSDMNFKPHPTLPHTLPSHTHTSSYSFAFDKKIRKSLQAVAAPEFCFFFLSFFFFWRRHWGGKIHFWGGKNKKNCQKWLIFAIFLLTGGGGQVWGQNLQLGENAPSCPIDAATVCKNSLPISKFFHTFTRKGLLDYEIDTGVWHAIYKFSCW